MQVSEELKNYIANLPQEPGVYRYYDVGNKLIYVGKAKKLKNRVSSYFQDSKNLNYKTTALVRQISRIEYTLVNSEFDALLLENSLIKENSPKYNIRLRDDKSFPYICITDEAYPKIISTRRFREIKGEYFGPYSNVKAMHTLIDSLKKLYNIRSCSLALTQKSIEKNSFKLCLEYHLGNCLAPCEGFQTLAEYSEKINETKKILKGNIGEAYNYLQNKMGIHSSNLEFEKAHFYKTKLELLDNFQNKSVVAGTKDLNLHVFAYTENEAAFYINHMEIINGSIISSKNVHLKKVLNEPIDEILIMVIFEELRNKNPEKLEIISNAEISNESLIKVHTPKVGDKKKIVDLSLKNALQYKQEKAPKEKISPALRILKQLQKDLSLKELPEHIECFDNSNIQGTNPVASMVCFKQAKPSKKDYRHFKIKTVEGPNDFDSMYEIVTRRYTRLIEEKKALPNLIIIDGGKGQLGMAQKALIDLNINSQIPMIGIAKRLEEIYTPEDSDPLYIDKKSESLKLIQQLRNEAHRFAITFHRNLRSKNSNHSELEAIEGVGVKTIKILLSKYKTLSKLKAAGSDELSKLIGFKRASIILAHLNKKRSSN